MAKQATRPATRPEAGSGVNIRAEISIETHNRMRLEIMRRKSKGESCTAQDLLIELIEAAKDDWPEFNPRL